MNCPNCNRDIGELKKYEYVNCKCGKQLMCIKDGKNLILVKLGVDKGEN
jgi:Zn finger protein HypA/HybF involved in hydrogenase expression